MKKWRGTILLSILLVVVIAGLAYIEWYRRQPTPAEYITVAQTVTTGGGKSNSQVLSDYCGQVEWKHSRSAGGQELVEATGTLKDSGRPVVVRWQVTILQDRKAKVSIANPVFASVGGQEIEPPTAFVTKLGEATVDK
jgi:hypothetical protein